MTLTEYLVDYASEETRKVGFRLIEKELQKIPKEKVRQIALDNIENIKKSNRRDFRFEGRNHLWLCRLATDRQIA